MTAFNLGMKIKGNLQDSILKYASHVRVLMGVTSNGKIKKKMLIRPKKIFQEGQLWEEELKGRRN